VAVDLVIKADAGGGTIPGDTLDLVVAKGLRQLGLSATIETGWRGSSLAAVQLPPSSVACDISTVACLQR